MSFTSSDLTNLKAELTNDPKHLTLTTVAADDQANADKLNAIAATSPLLIKDRSLACADIFNAIDPLEHQALTDQQARWLNDLLVLGQIDCFAQNNLVQALVGSSGLFSSNSTSYAAINAIVSVPGSRIDQMFQAGLLSVDQPVTPSDIANARAAT